MLPQKQKNNHKHEFDAFIENYRENQNKHVSLSGESGAFFAQYKAEKLYEWFPEYREKNITVLDFGCGDGLMTELVHKVFPQATLFGIDPSEKSIEVAQRNFKTPHFFWFDGNKTDFTDQSMDLIFAAGVFHHIPFEQHAACIKEIMRILKPGGRFVLFELNPLNPLTQITFKRSPVDRDAQMLWPNYAKKITALSGNLHIKYYCFFPHFARALRFLEPYMTWLPLGALYAVILKK
jgi:ubiquinone/menaquinone biosynthesis C-methylase UbiE